MHGEWQIFENGKEAQIQRMCGFVCVCVYVFVGVCACGGLMESLM